MHLDGKPIIVWGHLQHTGLGVANIHSLDSFRSPHPSPRPPAPPCLLHIFECDRRRLHLTQDPHHLRIVLHLQRANLVVGGCKLSQFETNGLKGLYFQGVETQAFSTRGVKVMCATCTPLLTTLKRKSRIFSARQIEPASVGAGIGSTAWYPTPGGGLNAISVCLSSSLCFIP